jgi:hypothetical protein
MVEGSSLDRPDRVVKASMSARANSVCFPVLVRAQAPIGAVQRLCDIGSVHGAPSDPGTDTSSLAPNQQDLADMIGTTRQRVDILMGRFRKLGLIDYETASGSTALS